MGLGLRVVIAESFGDIFFNNCFQNGMLPIVLPKAQVDSLAEAARGGARVTIDLVSQQVTSPTGEAFGFDIDAQRRQALLEGLDEIGRTFKLGGEIEAWQVRDRLERPWVWELA
jgi:3-isopropylmalate/(R)-2-methylmalate dehydratase small subunit